MSVRPKVKGNFFTAVILFITLSLHSKSVPTDLYYRLNKTFFTAILRVILSPARLFVTERNGTERSRAERNGTERNGTVRDRTGQDRTGQDRTGQDRTGQDRIIVISQSFLPVWLPCTVQYFRLCFVRDHAPPYFYGIIVGCFAGHTWENSNTCYTELPKFSFNLCTTYIIYKSAGHGLETRVINISLFGTH